MYKQEVLTKIQKILCLLVLGTTILFFGIYKLLCLWSDSLEQPVRDAYKELESLNVKNRAELGFDLNTANSNLIVAQNIYAKVQQLESDITRAISIPQSVREKLYLPFQLLDYEQERLNIMDDFLRLAEAQKITIDQAFLSGLPDYVIGRENPSLLWPQLYIAKKILTLAFNAKPAVLKSASALPVVLYSVTNSNKGVIAEVPIYIEFYSTSEAALSFLYSIPWQYTNLNSVATNNFDSSLFIQRVMIRSITNNVNWVSLEAVISGFFGLDYRENPIKTNNLAHDSANKPSAVKN